METTKPLTGPYRATRLWNEAIRIFNNGVPRKRHWRQLRQYENCFTATEATSWLHAQLKANPHFGPTVTKEQTQQLLCKFLKAGVFEDVRSIGSKVENFKDNSGLYRLTNRSPFRNPRTPGRTPLRSLGNCSNSCGDHGSPKLGQAKRVIPVTDSNSLSSPKSTRTHHGKTLVQCQLTAKQLNHQEVEEIWKNTTLRRITKIFDLSNLNSLIDCSQIQGKWVLWNVTHIGARGVVQSMDEKDTPPSWVLYGMKSLVNWPSNENHKLPEYQGSEKDVFKVICDYFTNVTSPLSTFSLYNILVEAFIRSEAADLNFRKSKESSEGEEDGFSLCSRDSVRNLVMQMASPMQHKTSTPIDSYYQERKFQREPEDHQSFPVIKSPLASSRAHRGWRIQKDLQNIQPSSQKQQARQFLVDEVKPLYSNFVKRGHNETRQYVTPVGRRLNKISINDCYETAFTTAEPITRMVSQNDVTASRRSRSSDHILNERDSDTTLGSQTFRRDHGRDQNGENSSVYHSLDRLRSKSGGYVNVAAFGSMDCLDRSSTERRMEIGSSTWTSNSLNMHSRSISSLSCHRVGVTGLSPSSFSDASVTTNAINHNYENVLAEDSPSGLNGQLRVYRNSPSKRLIGRRKGLEFYYGAKACKPGLVTPEGKAMAIELLQLLTLLLPPDRRRKLHLILRFMAKVSANNRLVLDSEIPTKTLMVNTFYRCIICSPEEADYDELLAVRLVTFLMENAEDIMTVPHQLCSQVRDLLVDMQREKIRFQLDDVVPLAYCLQVSPQRFEEQRKNESDIAIRQLLEHIVNDQNMSLKEKRKRLKQFQNAYPAIYFSKFPCIEAEAFKNGDNPQSQRSRPSNQATMLARIRSLRLT